MAELLRFSKNRNYKKITIIIKCNICKNKKIKLLNYLGKYQDHSILKKKIIKKYKFSLGQCNRCSIIQLEKNGSDQSFVPVKMD